MLQKVLSATMFTEMYSDHASIATIKLGVVIGIRRIDLSDLK